eukprot:GFKZ01001704.1.p1 GENE.GFKZ01001704.1~~GFKZ01001704.1.p1  ORF type:complete len:526 (+),score=113.13 GFKZ01001704.1:223-1800(+)
MSAFAALASHLLLHSPFHNNVCKRRVPGGFPQTTMLNSPVMRAPGQRETPDPDDDDATMGRYQGSQGIRLPNFTKEDQDYLNAATSSEEYVARMMNLAKQKDMERKIANAKSGSQTADDYVESLRRKPTDLSDQPYDSKGASAASDYMESLNVREPPDLSGASYNSKGINSGEEYIRNLNAMHERDATTGPDVTPAPFEDVTGEDSSDSATKSTDQIQDLQAFLRQSAGIAESDLSPENSVDINRIDQDIDELETRLRKVVLGENPDGSPAAPTAEDVQAMDEKFKEIRSQMPGFDDNAESSSKAIVDKPAEDVAVVDKQIGFLENYLEKLKHEQEEENAHPPTAARLESSDSWKDDKLEQSSKNEGLVDLEESEMLQVAGSGEGSDQEKLSDKFRDAMQMLSDKVDEQPRRSSGKRERADALSEEEKMEAFNAIRRELMKQRGQTNPDFADPLAAPLPEKKSDVPRAADEDEDIDLSSANIPGGYFLISEVEAEVKKYLFDARSMLDDHERRMKGLIRKLRDLE